MLELLPMKTDRIKSAGFLFVLFMLIWLLHACQVIDPALLADLAGTKELFRDDFSDPSSGWNRTLTPDLISDYTMGVYRIIVNQPEMNVLAKPGLMFLDAHIEVDTGKYSGADNNLFGIACRVNDRGGYYTFLVSSDGYYGIGKMKNGEHTLLGSAMMEYSDAINKGQAPNHLTVDCVGSTLALSVNGQNLASVQDAEWTSGDVGLIVGTFETAGADIIFDNFSVTKP